MGKMQKSEEKRKISRSGRYVTIFPLFFSYFPPIFLLLLLLLHFSGTKEARAKNRNGLGLRKTRKWGWMGGTGQNGVVLAYFFKKGNRLQNDVVLVLVLLNEQGPKQRRFGPTK